MKKRTSQGGEQAGYKAREVKPEREACGEALFWHCNTCGASSSNSTRGAGEAHALLHRVKTQEFPGPFGPRLVLVRDRVRG